MRYTWSGTLCAGVVAVPVQLGNAVGEEKPLLHRHHKADGGAAKQKWYCALDGKELDFRNDVTRAFTAANGTVVLLDDADFETVYGERSRKIEIARFTDAASLPRAAHKSSYFVRPLPGGEKAYALLATAMREAGKAAEVSVAIAQREAVGLVHATPDGYLELELLQWAADVRQPDFQAPNPVLTAAEMKLADALVREMSGESGWAAAADPTAERLAAVIAAKQAAGQVVGVPAAAPDTGAVLDLTAALKASVAKAKADKAAGRPAAKPRTRKAAVA